MNALNNYDAARAALTAAVAVDEVKEIHDKATAMQAYARQANDKQMEADAYAIRQRALRRLGELMQAQKETVGLNKGAAEPGANKRGLENNPRSDARPTLAEAGIDKNLANAARKAATKSETEFEQDVEQRRTGKPKPVRPKRKDDPDLEARKEKVIALADGGMSAQTIADTVGYKDSRTVHQILEHERIKREASAKLSPDSLSMTAKEKLETLIRQYKRKLDHDFQRELQRELKERLESTILPHYKQTYETYQQAIKTRMSKSIMTRANYRLVLSCLHPDRVQDDALKKRYEAAFRIFTELEKRVLDENDSPTPSMRMPTTVAEMDAMRAKVQAERRARRAASKAAVSVR
jgi:hypothetical protein